MATKGMFELPKSILQHNSSDLNSLSWSACLAAHVWEDLHRLNALIVCLQESNDQDGRMHHSSRHDGKPPSR